MGSCISKKASSESKNQDNKHQNPPAANIVKRQESQIVEELPVKTHSKARQQTFEDQNLSQRAQTQEVRHQDAAVEISHQRNNTLLNDKIHYSTSKRNGGDADLNLNSPNSVVLITQGAFSNNLSHHQHKRSILGGAGVQQSVNDGRGFQKNLFNAINNERIQDTSQHSHIKVIDHYQDEEEESPLEQSDVRLEFQSKNPNMGSRGGQDEDQAECIIEEVDDEIMFAQDRPRKGDNNNYITSGTGSRPVLNNFTKASSPFASVVPKTITKNLTRPHHRKNKDSIQGAHQLIYQQSQRLRDGFFNNAHNNEEESKKRELDTKKTYINDDSIERQMLFKYVTTWNELALAYQRTGQHFHESVESFQTAITIYEKILMHTHLQFALPDYLISTFMVKAGDDSNPSIDDQQQRVESIIEANEHLFGEIVSPNSRSSAQESSRMSQLNQNSNEIIRRTLTTLKSLEGHQDCNIYLYFACTVYHLVERRFKSAQVNLSEIDNILKMPGTLLDSEYLQYFTKIANMLRSLILDDSNASELHLIGETGGSSRYPSQQQNELAIKASIISLINSQGNNDPTEREHHKREVFEFLFSTIRDAQLQFLINQGKGYYLYQPQLVELLASNPIVDQLSALTTLYEQVLKLAHIIRVWLLLPQQALIFYEIALQLCQNHLTPSQQAQAYFFIGLAYKGLKQYQEAIIAYNRAFTLCPYYTDCYFNLGNLYFEGVFDEEGKQVPNLEKAQYCHLQALLSLEEIQKIEHYKQLMLDNNEEVGNDIPNTDAPQSIVTIARVCNMLGEIAKRGNYVEEAINYYLKGIRSDPIGYFDNYGDLAEISESLGHPGLSLIIQRVSQILCQLNDGNLQDNQMILTPEEWDELELECRKFQNTPPFVLETITVLMDIVAKYQHDLAESIEKEELNEMKEVQICARAVLTRVFNSLQIFS